jgi:hypothetical protein
MFNAEEHRLVGIVIGGVFDGHCAVYAANTFAAFACNPDEVWRVAKREIREATIHSRGGIVWQVRSFVSND